MEIKISGTPQEIKELLQVIASNEEQNERCVVCDDLATLELENGEFICETCAQIQGELSESTWN